jgi:AbrB family looped-hinge helix DNA binding protein
MPSIKGTGTVQMLEEGRVTIPAAVRRQLGLKQGDFVRIDVHPIEMAAEGNDEQ